MTMRSLILATTILAASAGVAFARPPRVSRQAWIGTRTGGFGREAVSGASAVAFGRQRMTNTPSSIADQGTDPERNCAGSMPVLPRWIVGHR